MYNIKVQRLLRSLDKAYQRPRYVNERVGYENSPENN